MSLRIEDYLKIKSYAGLIRYLTQHDIDITTANSFARLLKDSRYDEVNKRFVFYSVHPHYTEPRLRRLSQGTGILRAKANEITFYQHEYFWQLTERLGEDFIDSVLAIKKRKYKH